MRDTFTRRVLAALFAAALACSLLAPVPARAAGLDDYTQRLQEAEELAGDALSETDPDSIAELSDRMRELLPADEVLTIGGEPVEVGDPVIHEMLDELDDAATTAERKGAADRLHDRLLSLRVVIGVPSSEERASDPEALARILEEERIGDSGMPSWIQEIGRRIQEWLDKLMPDLPEIPEPVFEWVLPTMSALAVLVAVWVVWRLWRRGVARRDGFETVGEDGASLPVVAVAEGLPEDVLSFADRAASEGRYRDAVRALFGGAARELGERGVLTRTRTRTTHELLRDVAAARGSLGGPLGELAAVFEPAWYGHRDPARTGFMDAREAYVRFSAMLAGDAS